MEIDATHLITGGVVFGGLAASWGAIKVKYITKDEHYSHCRDQHKSIDDKFDSLIEKIDKTASKIDKISGYIEGKNGVSP